MWYLGNLSNARSNILEEAVLHIMFYLLLGHERSEQ
jgi:hypothetical protein